jgi:hypothetical protein
MRSIVAVGIVAAALNVSAALAQSPAVTVFRPDTMGANFDHTRIGTGTPTDFDFLEGVWAYKFQARDRVTYDKWEEARTGTWTGFKTHENLIVEDEFSTQLPNGSHSMTITYRVFDPDKKVWQIQGVAARIGNWSPGVAWSDGAARYLVQQNPAQQMLLRIKYYNITPGRFNWRADGSRDGGKTWVPDVMLIEATRVGNAKK